MAQAKIVLPAVSGLDNELMGYAIYKLGQLGTIEGGIDVSITQRPDYTPDDVPQETVFLEFRANVIPYLGRR